MEECKGTTRHSTTRDEESENMGGRELLNLFNPCLLQREDRRAHIEKIRADGESFKKLKQGQLQVKI